MKITVTTESDYEEEWKYPCLVVDEKGTIMLATGCIGKYFLGIVLISDLRREDICINSTPWNKENFKKFKGALTLRNN